MQTLTLVINILIIIFAYEGIKKLFVWIKRNIGSRKDDISILTSNVRTLFNRATASENRLDKLEEKK